MQTNSANEGLGPAITRASSLQTYYTVRFLVDRELVGLAYQAYAYFRWVDDWLDEPGRQRTERLSFVERQRRLIEACCRGEAVNLATEEEAMLVELLRADGCAQSGLHAYVRNMMAVMSFDAERRGRLISAAELAVYQHSLAVAVSEALHYFIGHETAAPQGPERYLAAEGAHIVHMLRDAVEDHELGYFNIPREVVRANGISPEDIGSEPYRLWVRSRVQLAHRCFAAGRRHLAQVPSLRCRLAGYAYMARFQSVLDSIEREGYLLRGQYREAKSPMAGALMGWSVLQSALSDRASAKPAQWSADRRMG